MSESFATMIEKERERLSKELENNRSQEQGLRTCASEAEGLGSS